MKTFKRIDLAVQLILITGFAIIALVRRDETFIYGYFAVGFWQLISMAIHFINNWHLLKGRRRYNYHLFTLALFLLFGISALISLTAYLLFFLLIASPFMAVYYSWICYKEVFFYSKRPLELI